MCTKAQYVVVSVKDFLSIISRSLKSLGGLSMNSSARQKSNQVISKVMDFIVERVFPLVAIAFFIMGILCELKYLAG